MKINKHILLLVSLTMAMHSRTPDAQTLTDSTNLVGGAQAGVALSGETAIVEDAYSASGNRFNVYTRDQWLNWSLQDQIIVPVDASFGGGVLALDNNIVALGYFNRDRTDPDTGTYDYIGGGEVWIYSASPSGQWELQATLNQTANWERFGRSVAVSGNTIAVASAPFYRVTSDIFVYEKSNSGDWSLQSRLSGFANLNQLTNSTFHSDYHNLADGCCNFNGSVLDISGNSLIALLSNAEDYGYKITDAVIYVRDANNDWVLQATLPADNYSTVAIHSNTAMVTTEGTGTFYQRNEGGWRSEAVFEEPESLFGVDVALGENYAMVTAAESVYHYKRGEQDQWQKSGRTIGVLSGSSAISATTAIVSGSTDSTAGGYVIDLTMTEQDSLVCIDTGVTGDGWGWNGIEPCQLPNPNEVCNYDQADLNNGWGWNPASRVGCAPLTDNTSACIDTGIVGDGWGWNGTASCRL